MAERIFSLRVIKTILGLLGIFGNFIVCLVIYKIASMHTTTNAFIFNQALIDFLGSTILLLSSNIPTPFPLSKSLAGDLHCRIWLSDFFLWSFLTASTLNLVSLTFERYVAIVYPFRHQRLYGPRAVCFLIVSVWVIGTASSFYDIAFYDIVDGKCQSISVPGSQAVGVMIFLIQYFLPVCAMLFAYSHIIVVLKRSAKRVGPSVILPAVATSVAGTSAPIHRDNSTFEAADKSLLRARRNTFKTLLIVFITYVICWSLNAVVFFMFNFGYPLDFNGAIYIISVALVASNSCANPMIYAVKYRQFRRGLKQLLGVHIQETDIPTTSSNVA